MITGRETGVTGAELTEYLMATLSDPELENRYKGFEVSRSHGFK